MDVLVNASPEEILVNLLTERYPDLDKIGQFFQTVDPFAMARFSFGPMPYIYGLIKIRSDVLDHILNLLKIDIDHVDEYGDTLLHRAALSENIGTVKYLLDKGANPRIKNKSGMSLLMYSLYNHNVFSLVLKNGGDPHERNYIGESVFSKALEISKDEIIRELLKIPDLDISPELDNLLVSLRRENNLILFEDPRFYPLLFHLDYREDTIINLLVKYEMLRDDSCKLIPVFIDYHDGISEYVDKTIRNVKRVIMSNGMDDFHRKIPIFKVSVIDTIFDSFNPLSQSDEEGYHLVVLTYVGELNRIRRELVIESENKMEERFFKLPTPMPDNGLVYSYVVPREFKTWKELASSVDPGGFLNFIIEGENVNNSDIEIDEGVTLTVEVKREIAGIF